MVVCQCMAIFKDLPTSSVNMGYLDKSMGDRRIFKKTGSNESTIEFQCWPVNKVHGSDWSVKELVLTCCASFVFSSSCMDKILPWTTVLSVEQCVSTLQINKDVETFDTLHKEAKSFGT